MRHQLVSALQLSPNLLAEPPLAAPVVQLVKCALARLSPREVAVLRLHFGLNGRSHDLAAVARLTGLTIPAVRRIRRVAFSKLRWLAAEAIVTQSRSSSEEENVPMVRRQRP